LCAPITSSFYDRLVNVRIREIDGPLYATALSTCTHIHARARAHELSRRFVFLSMRPRVRPILTVSSFIR